MLKLLLKFFQILSKSWVKMMLKCEIPRLKVHNVQQEFNSRELRQATRNTDICEDGKEEM